ncbi:hypothetical protein [Formosa sp. A9]|uniref:hypothetical protein n=1 Tax=Formosa sp. A9 TaxID=3442641 RepID=UPI003EBA3D3E
MYLSEKLKNKIGFILSFLIGLLMLFISYLNLNDNSEKRKIIGTFKQLLLKNGLRGNDYYVININEYENDFLISNLYLKAFNQTKFSSNVRQKDTLSIIIDKNVDLEKNNGEVLSITSKNIEFINQKTWKKIEKSNGNIGIVLGIIFLGISIYILKRK